MAQDGTDGSAAPEAFRRLCDNTRSVATATATSSCAHGWAGIDRASQHIIKPSARTSRLRRTNATSIDGWKSSVYMRRGEARSAGTAPSRVA